MPDLKAVENVKRLEEQLATARETARGGFLAAVNESLEQLRAIGFEYELVAKGGTPESKARVCGNCGGENHTARTCPRKEKANGAV